jgi:hypothetical protein
MSHVLKSPSRAREGRPASSVQYRVSGDGVATTSAAEVLSQPHVQAQLRAVGLVRAQSNHGQQHRK